MDQSVYGGSQIVSAAVLSGQLIIGLADGKVIDCGRVQGPQGLRGDRGPIGATGSPGVDGNTILAGKGPPRADLGKDGDFYINNRDWFVFGPKSGGMWGAGQGMLPKDIAPVSPGGTSAATGGGGGGGNGGGSIGTIFTSNVVLTDPTRNAINTKQGYKVLPDPGTGNTSQRDANQWAFGDAFDQIDQAIPVYIGDLPPNPLPGYLDNYVGRLWFDSSEDDWTLYVYTGPDSEWVPAAPPVSTEGIESNIKLLNEAVQGLQATASSHTLQIADAQSTQYGLAQAAAVTAENVQELQTSQAEQDTKIEALEASQTVQDNQIIELEEEIESLAPSLDRGKWNLAELGEGVTLAAGQYAMGIGANRVYCEEQYAQCLAAIDGNPSENPEASGECNRIASACFNAVDNGTEYFMNDWSHATLLHFHKTDSEGKNHTFNDYEVGMFIDLFDQGDTGFAVFEITAAATLDGDVYTIGVHPVQHEGEAAGLARVKVFELSGADPTEFVRNTGDTMTGALYIRPPKDSAGLRIYAPQGDAGAGQADATQLVRVANSHNQYVFYVEESGAIAGKDGMLPTVNRHLTSKKYVDELIAAELTAPARFEWKVYVNADGTPLQGSANLNGASMSDTSVIRLHKHAQNAPVPIKGHGSGLTMYKYSPSPKLYHSTILSAWSKSGAEWQWKGTAEIDEIKLFSDYIQIKLGYRKESNMNFSNTGYYRFTVGGLF